MDPLSVRENLASCGNMDIVETERILVQIAQQELGIPLSGVDANFFAEGVDSV
jgi:hypothetical protein